MKIVTLDIESFYSKDYSLRKMTPPEYILSPLFESTGLAVKEGDAPAYWVDGDDVQRYFDQADENVMSISHNSLFDNCVFAWRYGWVPKLMCDTLGVSRAMLRKDSKSLALAKVAELLNLGTKGHNLANVIGMRNHEIKAYPDLHRKHIEYGLNDAELCYGIFKKLVIEGGFPKIELAVMDAVIRCAVEPRFKVNLDVLRASLHTIKQEKENTLAQSMLLGAEGKKTLMSNDAFAGLLRQHGVEPPVKISATTGKLAYAFSKQDQDFIDLLEHPNTAIQTLVAARMGHKSTIEESRHERFIAIGSLEWPKTRRNPGGYTQAMPMPIRYAGAHTHRLSGDWKLNVQNMGRGSPLRESLEAPEGYVVVAGDESQVEARFVVTLCGQEDVRMQFQLGQDVYSIFASDLFGFIVTKNNKIERFIGKQCILGLGFGLGPDKFTKSIPLLAWNQLKMRLEYSLEEGTHAVNLYRTKNHAVKATWKLLNGQGINALTGGGDWQWGPVLFTKEEIVLPDGNKLYYKNLRQRPGGRFGMEWVFDYDGMTKSLYGGKILENVVQALARIVTMQAAVRIKARLIQLGIELALQVHDELVFVVKKEYEAVVRKLLEHELRRRPDWLPNLPLDCEVGSGPNYGEAK